MKMNRTRSVLLGMTLLAGAGLVGAVAMAQGMKTARPDPSKMPEFHGTVAHYDLTPRGDVDGLILMDGTEVHFPPHLGLQVVAAVRTGEDVTVHGEKNGTVIRAGSVTGQASGKTVVDQGPPSPPPGRPDHGPGHQSHPAGQPVEASGVVQMPLHGPRGEVNGVMLQDGTMIHMPPPEATRLASAMQPGQTVAVRGYGVDGAVGRSIEARELGPTPDKLVALQGPARPGPLPGEMPPSAAAVPSTSR